MNTYTSAQRSGELIISWKTGRVVAIVFLVFSLVWLSISSLIFLGTQETMLLFFMLIGFLVLYLALVQLINRNELRADRHNLSVSSGPLPWIGSKRLTSSDIDQLYVMQGGQEKAGAKVTPLYMLRAKMRNGDQQTLIQGIRSKEMALELENKIEQHLDIQDRALPNDDHPRLKKLKEKFPALKDLKLSGPINDGKPGAGSTVNSDPRMSHVAARLITGYSEFDVYARRLGERLSMTNENYEVIRHDQFDWSDGRIDISFDLIGGNGRQTSLYAEQKDHKYLYFEERILEADERDLIGFPDHGEPPAIIENGDQKYYRRNEVDGFVHVNHGELSEPAGQWIYFTTTADDRFRVLQKAGRMEVFIQEPVPTDNLKVPAENTDKLRRKR